MGRPSYARGTITREILDIVFDAAEPLPKKNINAALTARGFSSTLSSARIIMRRMRDRGHLRYDAELRVSAAIRPVPHQYEHLDEWLQAEGLTQPPVLS
jgi:hypothetical protein